MGVYLSVYRFSVPVAVDVLCGRSHIREAADKMRSDEVAAGVVKSPVWREPLRNQPSDYILFHKRYNTILDTLTGTVTDPYGEGFWSEHSNTPLSSVVYGARRIGWDRPDFPLKYSLHDDISDICDALASVTETDIQHNVETLIASGTEIYSDTAFQRQLREQFAPRLLPALRQFYHAAHEREEIVVYWMG